MKVPKYPISTLLVVTPQTGVFYPHPEICIVSDYDSPLNQFQLNGEIHHKEWLGLYPYNRDAFQDRKLGDIMVSIEATKYYISIEGNANKYIQPYLYQFNERLIYKSTGSIWSIERIDFEGRRGKIGDNRHHIIRPRGFLFFMVPEETDKKAHWITRGELENSYTLI